MSMLMSVAGHSLPIHSAPMSNNVRYASDSDHSRHECEMTLRAISGLMHRSKTGAIQLGNSAIGRHDTGG